MNVESTGLAGRIGDFAVQTSLGDVPASVLGFSRLLLLDTLGALLGGLRYPAVQALGRALSSDERCGAGDAPFARLLTLGTAATWLDADSGGSFHPQGHRLPPVPTAHPAPHSLPVLLHEAAASEIDDRRLLEVFVVANEIGMRAGVASSLRPGLHPHGVHGPGAAAVAAALLRGGTAAEVGAAFVLGSSLPVAATLAVPMHGGTVRNVWTGLGAYYGACASQWVAGGAVASEPLFVTLFDHAVCENVSMDELVGDLGVRWQLASSYLKPYACARWIHPALDALQLALAGAGPTAEAIETVEVDTFAFAASLDSVEIGSDMAARFSLPYCLATLATDGELHAGSFLPAGLSRQPVLDLARRVVVREDAAYSAALPVERPARVTLRLSAGEVRSAEVSNARGNPSAPLAPDEVERKFRRNVGDLLPQRLADDVVASLTAPQQDAGSALTRLAREVVASSTG